MKQIFERFGKRGTNYYIVIQKLTEEQRKQAGVGGKFMVTLGIADRGKTYFLNSGYKDKDYIAEKFTNGKVTGDTKSFVEKLGEYFDGEKQEKLNSLEPVETDIENDQR